MFFISTQLLSQDIAVIHYNGGGDWYANPTALPNLIKFCNDNINTTINKKPKVVSPSSVDLFDYPFVHMTGHGNVYFTDDDAKNLRDYLLSGGFLHIDDNYGMDEYLRKELIKVFPDKKLEEISKNHPLFNKPFPFPSGLPKIHEHNRNRPQAFAIYVEERIVLLYTYESDLGDGWENSEIHNDPQEIRLKALRMGANIINYAFLN
jgi:hypothetical protein